MMKAVTIKVTDQMYAQLARAARDNGRRLPHELVCRIAETMRNTAKARRAKIAILASTLVDAIEYARAHGWSRDQWFYAYSVDSATGRFVSLIEIAGTYRRRRDHDAIIRHLEGGQSAAKAIIADAVAHGE